MTDKDFTTATKHAQQLSPDDRQQVSSGLLAIAARCSEALGATGNAFNDLFASLNPLK